MPFVQYQKEMQCSCPEHDVFGSVPLESNPFETAIALKTQYAYFYV